MIDRGRYRSRSGRVVDLGAIQRDAERDTRLYTPAELDRLRAANPSSGAGAMRIELIDATTQVAARDLARSGSVLLLSFASARNPGGGFLNGAKAQEEDLCRCSGLYRALLTQPTYYTHHRAEPSLLYSDHAIYSPRVPFFRTSGREPMSDELFLASVITAPAPNAGALRQRQPEAEAELRETFRRRWCNILAIAEERAERVLVLGAWGCGAFRNDPHLVAESAQQVVTSPRFAGAFDHIVFAIPGGGARSSANLAAFRDVFAGTPAPAS